jgi:hypothetical protein
MEANVTQPDSTLRFTDLKAGDIVTYDSHDEDTAMSEDDIVAEVYLAVYWDISDELTLVRMPCSTAPRSSKPRTWSHINGASQNDKYWFRTHGTLDMQP